MAAQQVNFLNSLGFKGSLGLFAIALCILAGVVFVVSTDGKRLVLAESSQKMEQIVNNAVEDVNTRSQQVGALVRSMSALAEGLPKDKEFVNAIFPPVINFDGDLKVAGGGFWPEPNAFAEGVNRHSFFWGREADGSFKFYDNYNGSGPLYDESRFNTDAAYKDSFLAAPGYHNEEWYVSVRYARPGSCLWSSSYMDPYSFQPMVTCTVGTFDGANKLTGTVTVDLKLEGIEDDVRRWEGKTGGYLAIFDRNGKFLAFPRAGTAVKNINTDDKGNKTEQFKTANEFGETETKFKPIADAITAMNDEILSMAASMPEFNKDMAAKIDADSYQIDAEGARFLAAMIADPMKEKTRQSFLYKTIEIKDDFLLGEPSLVFIFHVPNSYWKYVLVKPLSEATAVATNLSNTLLLKISVLIAAVIAAAYLLLRYTLVQRLSETTAKVHYMGTLVADGRVGDLRGAKIENTGKDEIGLLARVVNNISSDFADKHEEVEEMNRTLEQKVEQRTQELARKTRDIQTMLENMHQGIFTILEDSSIHPEYAAHLEEILESKNIAGANFMALIFAHADLSADQRDQIATAVAATIGMDPMMFDCNRHLLVSEAQVTVASGAIKTLEFDWDPITNDADEVEKIMVTVRDVTQVRALRAEAATQKRELEMIGQLLAISQEKFHAFVESCQGFIVDNRKLLQSHPDKDLSIVAELFRNMHTIKGNARTYNLLHLTGLVHETEAEYDDLRKNPDADWDAAHMLAQLDAVEGLVNEYAQINEHKLGRKGAGRRGDASKYLMVEQEKLAQKIRTLETVDGNDAGALRIACATVLQQLRLIGTETMQEVLQPVLESAQALARELNKPEPNVQIADNGIVLKNQIVGLLRNSFMHVLRNSLDHGLESATDRCAAGKPECGCIALELALDAQRLHMVYRDDGRGLWLAKIKEKAITNGVLSADGNYSDQDIAALIFHSGLSTATTVSEVSGRGVGMDAVQKFIEREGGSIAIRLRPDIKVAAEFAAFEFVLELPAKFAVRKT